MHHTYIYSFNRQVSLERCRYALIELFPRNNRNLTFQHKSITKKTHNRLTIFLKNKYSYSSLKIIFRFFLMIDFAEFVLRTAFRSRVKLEYHLVNAVRSTAFM